ncbi:sulfotransferase [Sciscionella sediminilitoris]|uniref:sulfotransferase n=1 Tax=Sciscionella sediminilitoris TaxID=1445613 RepID=UPI00068DE0CB|nr:sulfotransferase [Sciscionella sp. SE31]
MSLTFIVGTGRCGSTMLSKALQGHPQVLSLSEFFAALRHRAFPAEPLDGQGFWELLRKPDPLLDAMMRAGARKPAWHGPSARRSSEVSGVPVIRHVTLPALSDDPDRLYEELAGELPHWPRRPIGDHYRDLFGWFTARFGRQVFVERSGASLLYVQRLRRMFPEARFVHLYRDGPDCALSMSRHYGFRLMLLPRAAARAANVPVRRLFQKHISELPADYQRFFRAEFSEESLMGVDLSLRDFGEFWSSMICNGVGELADTDHLDLCYEQLLADPRGELGTLASYLGVSADPGWIDRVSAGIDRFRSGTAQRLDPVSREELRTACAPGELALIDPTASTTMIRK